MTSSLAAVHVALHTGPLTTVLAAWASLHAVCPWATPFTSAAWAQAWWPCFARGGEPFLLVVREGDEVIGLAPLIRRRRGPVRMLEAIGMEPGDYWDVLAAPGRREEVARAVVGGLVERRREWDAWVLRCLPDGSPVEAALDGSPLSSVLWPRIPAPVIELPDSFDAYLKTLSSNRRQNLKRHLKRLDSGEVTLREVTDPADFERAVWRWQILRAQQWEAADRAINSAHLTQPFGTFMRRVAEALVPCGQAQVWEFLRDGEHVGSYLNFADDQAYHWYLGGFDPAHAKLGLGKIAIGHGIRESIAAGRARYDFGRGAEEYKYWYGAQDLLLAARVVGHGGPRSRAALAAATVQRRRRGD